MYEKQPQEAATTNQQLLPMTKKKIRQEKHH